MTRYWVVAVALLAVFAPSALGYSVLTHEAIIDSAWDQNIKPLLLKRFPRSSPDELLQAHAYAYGGCIIQDMGYYPFGSKFFSDLVHYVRSGDFVLNLISESQDLNEYAFALGSLAHYAADNSGHPIAVNPAVPMVYPKLRRQYGSEVTYAENPTAHIRVEFGFDVLQVGRGHYAPESYRDFIGFKVAKPLLDRAFHDTYNLELRDVFANVDLALGTYRRAVSKVIPEMTQAAWSMKKQDLVKAQPGITRRRFVYNLSRASYEKEWDREYQRPGIGARILAFFLRFIPKIGLFRVMAFKAPTSRTATMFEASFNQTLDLYRKLLAESGRGRLTLPDRDLDTGRPTRPAEYSLADRAYSRLAIKLAERDPASLDPKLLNNVLAFYRDLDAGFDTRKDPGEWRKTLAALDKLKAALPANATDAAPAPSTLPAPGVVESLLPRVY